MAEKVNPKARGKGTGADLCFAVADPPHRTAPMACALVALHCGTSDLSTSLTSTDVTPTQKLGEYAKYNRPSHCAAAKFVDFE